MSSTVTPLNPKPYIRGLIGKVIRIKLKWGMEYIGTLKYADAYVNLALEHVHEFIDGESHGYMKELLIRCNNIMYLREFIPGQESSSEKGESSSEKGEEEPQEEEEELEEGEAS